MGALGGGVFEEVAGLQGWAIRPATRLQALIVENDVRALFYEAFAKQLQAVLVPNPDDARLTVRYVGGCLRAPMLLTRADTLLGRRTGAESFLQQQWRTLAGATYPVRLPFWMDAVLARSRHPNDVGKNVGELRRRARRFRRRRSELEQRLRAGDETSLAAAAAALQQEADKLSTRVDLAATATLSAAQLGVRAVAGPLEPVADIVEPIASAAKGPLSRGLLRLFRPELWLIYRIADEARHARRSLERAVEIFDLPEEVALEQPAAFMERLGRTSWIA